MKRNIGNVDRAIRIVVGLVLIGLALSEVTAWGWLGLLPLVTAAIGFCPPYALLGINTCGVKSDEQKKTA